MFFDETELAGVTGFALRDLAVRDPSRSVRHAVRARPWIARATTGRSRAILRRRVLNLTDLVLVDPLLIAGRTGSKPRDFDRRFSRRAACVQRRDALESRARRAGHELPFGVDGGSWPVVVGLCVSKDR